MADAQASSLLLLLLLPSSSSSLVPTRAWRRTAAVNTTLAAVVSVVLAALLITSARRAGSVEGSLVFYEGSCGGSNTVNILVHLVINVASTCVIASSNFFMQVLGSPTRDEVDRAHARGRALEIGVPSVGNMRHVSASKSVLWLLFAVSSVPLHVFFNSAVFEVDYQGSGFFMAMATDAFASGQDYHGPGASLVPPGARLFDNASESIGFHPDTVNSVSWGSPVRMEQFLDQSSPAMRNLSAVSKAARSWTRLEGNDCHAQYGVCVPRRDYGNVLLVVDSQFHGGPPLARQAPAAGFVVDDIYNMTRAGVAWDPYNYTTDELEQYWDQFGPANQPNPLWFSAWCRVHAAVGSSSCTHSCAAAVGLPFGSYFDMQGPGSTSAGAAAWDIPLAQYNASISTDDQSGWSQATVPERPNFNTTSVPPGASLEITHCYAEPLEQTCKVALSNPILLIVTLCVVAKAVLSLLACVVLRGDPLVTPGDAMASFITNPGPTTEAEAAVGSMDGQDTIQAGSKDAPVSSEWGRKSRARVAAGIPRPSVDPYLRLDFHPSRDIGRIPGHGHQRHTNYLSVSQHTAPTTTNTIGPDCY